MAMKFIERENEILRTIKNFSDQGLEFIVVGGYAVSGLARHRFSVDLDVVIQRKDLEAFLQVIEDEGFEKHVEKTGFDEVYGGEFISCVKKIDNLPITVDLLVESLVCRATNASWSFGYTKRHSLTAEIAGIEASVRCRVPEKELLIAFKIHSGRRTDARDIVVLMEDADRGRIVEHLKRGNSERLRTQIDSVTTMLKDKRLVDSLKGVFTISYNVNNQIEKTRKMLEKMRNSA